MRHVAHYALREFTSGVAVAMLSIGHAMQLARSVCSGSSNSAYRYAHRPLELRTQLSRACCPEFSRSLHVTLPPALAFDFCRSDRRIGIAPK